MNQGPLETDPQTYLQLCVGQPAPARPARCLILLHGVLQNETTLAGLGAAVAADTLVVWVRSPIELAPEGYGCFHVNFTAAGPVINAAEAEASRLLLMRLVESVQTRHGVAPERTVLAGFSQGGIMSASVALTAPELLAGFAILGGRILPEITPFLASRARLARLRAFVGHGHADDKLPVSWAERARVQLDELGVAQVQRRYDCGHTVAPDMAADFLAWMNEVTGA